MHALRTETPCRGGRALRVAALALCAMALPPAMTLGGDQSYEYRVSWNGIPAAHATVRVTNPAGETAATMRMHAQLRTNRFLDLFWSLRAESWAEVEAAALRTRHFEYNRRINGRPERTSIEVEPDGDLTGRYARPGRYYLIAVSDPDVVDPLTGILRALRALPAAGQPQTYEIFTGESRYRIALSRAGTETIKVPAGRFPAVRIEPAIWRLDRQAPDARVRHLTLWVSEALPHTLLRVRSEVFIGAVYCDLTDLSGVELTAP